MGVNTSFALSLFPWISDASIFSNSSMSARPECLLSRFSSVQCMTEEFSWQDSWAKIDLDISFSMIEVIFDHCSQRYHLSVDKHSEPPFVRCFPIRQEILYVSQIAAALHGIRPPFFSSRPDCNSTADVPSLTMIQTHTTKLLDAKAGRLREHSQYYSARWSSLEIFDFCQ